MHIDIDLVRRQIEKQKRDRVAARHQQSSVAFLQGVPQRAVANPAAIEEEILRLGVAAVAGGVGDVAEEMGGALLGVDGVQLIAHLLAEEQADAL